MIPLADLLQEIRACSRCDLPLGPNPVLRASTTAQLLIVGQAPGVREPELQRPFAWTAGKTLFRWLESVSGADEQAVRQSVYFAAVCRCFPGKGPKGSGDRVPDADPEPPGGSVGAVVIAGRVGAAEHFERMLEMRAGKMFREKPDFYCVYIARFKPTISNGVNYAKESKQNSVLYVHVHCAAKNHI